MPYSFFQSLVENENQKVVKNLVVASPYVSNRNKFLTLCHHFFSISVKIILSFVNTLVTGNVR